MPGDSGALREEGCQLPGADQGGLHPAVVSTSAPSIPFEIVCKGGKRGGRGRPQAELSDIKARLSDLADDVLEGRQDKGVAAVASQVLNVLLRAISVETKLKEQFELVERLESLEEGLEQSRGRGSRWRA